MQINKNLVGLSLGYFTINKTSDKEIDKSLLTSLNNTMLKYNLTIETDSINHLKNADEEEFIQLCYDITYFIKLKNNLQDYTIHKKIIKYTNPNKEQFKKDVDFLKINYINSTDYNSVIIDSICSLKTKFDDIQLNCINWLLDEHKDKVYNLSIINAFNLIILNKPNVTVDSPTDILRFAILLSGGNPNQIKVPKIRTQEHRFNLNEKQKHRIMSLFETSNLSVDEMKTKTKYQRFIKLAEILKIGKFRSVYPKTFDIFNTLRNLKNQKNEVNLK
jgi:hypothetical protein